MICEGILTTQLRRRNKLDHCSDYRGKTRIQREEDNVNAINKCNNVQGVSKMSKKMTSCRVAPLIGWHSSRILWRCHVSEMESIRIDIKKFWTLSIHQITANSVIGDFSTKKRYVLRSPIFN